MGGLFGGLSIALSSLQAQKQVELTAAQNTANASTPGYSREVVNLSPVGYGLAGAVGQMGMGVMVDGIQRQRNFFLDLQYWSQNAAAGQYQTQQQALDEVQASLAEPGSSGLSAALSQFWAAWQTLSASPESMAARQSLIQTSQALTAQFNRLAGDLTSERQNLDVQVRAQVSQINQLAQQIGALNGQIQQAAAGAQPPNNLLDRRDELVNQLSQLVPLQVSSLPNGTDTIAIGGTDLVQGNLVQTIDVSSNAANNGFASLTWSQTQGAVAPSGGSLGALLDLRDHVLPGYQSQLDQVAATLVSQVNGQHAKGLTLSNTSGGPFFDPTGTTAATIQVDPGLTPDQVAAALPPGSPPGDGANAQAIADLQQQPVLSGATIGQAYAGFVSQVGADDQQATQAATNQQQMLQAVEQQRQSVSGVSLDQEMTTMVQAQHAYQAAAETINIINSMLGTLVQLPQ